MMLSLFGPEEFRPQLPLIRAYTDGACSLQPNGHGGWAWAIDRKISNWEHDVWFETGNAVGTTNQRMELTAAYRALKEIGPDLEIVSDSAYVVNCFKDGWYHKWIKCGWKRGNKPLANVDLWQPFVELYLSVPGRVKFTWVKGHSGDPMNDLVDRLAVQAKHSVRSH